MALPLWLRICCFIWKQIIENHAPFLLLSSPAAKNMEAGLRSCEVTPDLSIHVSACVYVCGWVPMSQSFQPAISPDQPPRHTHLPLSWSQGSKNKVPLAGTGMQNKILLLSDVSQCQKNSMCTCSNGSHVIFSFPAFGWHKECSVILHLFYNSVSTKLTLIAVINIHMHTYLSIPNLKNKDLSHLANNKHLISALLFLTPWNYFMPFNYLIIGFVIFFSRNVVILHL